MQFKFALISGKSASGQDLQFAVFGARPTDDSEEGKRKLLDQLTTGATRRGLTIDQSALAYDDKGEIRIFASGELLEHLKKNGLPPWTHFLEA